ncbi:Protein CLEC-53 [Aphelenchoides avenae]|nr:Protein CLEC-53 [Aphelenchus avenae]
MTHYCPILLAAIAVLLTGTHARCPSGTIQGLNERDCYRLYVEQLTWIEAEGRCKAEAGHLTSIPSAVTNGFLNQAAKNVSVSASYWTGGAYNALIPGQWSWSDRSKFSFNNWGPKQPIKGPVCLSLNILDAKWYSEPCNRVKSAICKVPDADANHNDGATPPPNLPTPPPPARCPAGWQYLAETNLCYQVLTSSYNWNNARSACVNAGGDLASIPSASANGAVLTYALNAQLSQYYVAIGLQYNSSASDNFAWTDGLSATFRNWYTGYPSSPSSSSCSFMKLSAPGYSQWVNLSCYGTAYAAICERQSFDF